MKVLNWFFFFLAKPKQRQLSGKSPLKSVANYRLPTSMATIEHSHVTRCFARPYFCKGGFWSPLPRQLTSAIAPLLGEGWQVCGRDLETLTPPPKSLTSGVFAAAGSLAWSSLQARIHLENDPFFLGWRFKLKFVQLIRFPDLGGFLSATV